MIAAEEFAPWIGQKVRQAEGAARLPFQEITGQKLKGVRSWGKHFLLLFEGFTLRIHFLMFGSYRLNDPRPDREAKMILSFGKSDKIYFYSCAIKKIDEDIEDLYDWSTDVMSDRWNARKALAKIQDQPLEMICDLLMDQNIFSGVGNIIKNEVLYNLKMHPETVAGALNSNELKALVKEARHYCFQFYEWKKKGELKKHWQIFRKKDCPKKHGVLEKRKTGKGQRFSFYCEKCQPLRHLAGVQLRRTRPALARSRASKDT